MTGQPGSSRVDMYLCCLSVSLFVLSAVQKQTYANGPKSDKTEKMTTTDKKQRMIQDGEKNK